MLTEPLSLDSTLDQVAAALFDSAMVGGPDDYDDDIVLKALHWHARQYLAGVCSLMAIHLNETRNLPVVVLEVREPGQEAWMFRHAAVTTAADYLDPAAFGDGMDIQILDAAGAGTFRDRDELYRAGDGWETRVLYARDSHNQFTRLMGEPRKKPVAIEDHVLALPGLCKALCVEFDLRKALEWILLEGGREGSGFDLDLHLELASLLSGPGWPSDGQPHP